MMVRHLFLATDWGSPPPFSFNGPVWSISAEVAVYAFFFLCLRRFAPGLSLCLAVIVVGLTLQLAGMDAVPVACATYFFAGGLATCLRDVPRAQAGWCLVALAALAWASGWLANRDHIPMALLIALPPLLLWLAGPWRLLDRWSGAIGWAGNLTYSSYLLHFPLQLALAIAAGATGLVPMLTSPLFLVAYLIATFGCAALSYRWLERPAQDWLRARQPTALR